MDNTGKNYPVGPGMVEGWLVVHKAFVLVKKLFLLKVRSPNPLPLPNKFQPCHN